MSLNIYFDGIDVPIGVRFEKDAEAVFDDIVLDGDDYDEQILSSIDRGRYNDFSHFIDRFGDKRSIDCLSIGSKVALSLYHAPDVLIWGGEVGCNALTEIVMNCGSGMLVLPARRHCVLRRITEVSIDVKCRGRHYVSLDEFSRYLMEAAPL